MFRTTTRGHRGERIGTVKIDGVPAEDGNDNKPHPGCIFTIEFFGYDAGVRAATAEFHAQSPRGRAPT